MWQLEVVDDVLYFGDFSDKATLGQITHADDAGNTPVLALIPPSPDDPFSFDEGPAYGIRKLLAVELDGNGNPTAEQADPNGLIIGTANDFNARPNDLLDDIFVPDGEFVLANPFRANRLQGSGEEDLILGSLFGDRINAGGEDDIIFADALGFGLAGIGLGDRLPARVFGRSFEIGTDTISGGDGQDVIFGMGGADIINGDDGEDIIIGGEGRDTIRGGAGIDLISGDGLTDGPLGDIIMPLFEGLLGGLGDAVEGVDMGAIINSLLEIDPRAERQGRLDDRIYGDGGNDIIIAGGGDDRVFGGAGGDGLLGLSGDDFLQGNAGIDVIDGGIGDDIMRGGKGDDVIITGLGDDLLRGDRGNDRFLVQDDDDNSSTITTGEDTIAGFQDGDVIDLSAFFQNPISPFLATIPEFPLFQNAPYPAFDFDLQIGQALTVMDNGVLIDLSLIDGGFQGEDTNYPNPADPPANFGPAPTGSGTIFVAGVSELTEEDFVVNTQLLSDGLGVFV